MKINIASLRKVATNVQTVQRATAQKQCLYEQNVREQIAQAQDDRDQKHAAVILDALPQAVQRAAEQGKMTHTVYTFCGDEYIDYLSGINKPHIVHTKLCGVAKHVYAGLIANNILPIFDVFITHTDYGAGSDPGPPWHEYSVNMVVSWA